ncbi:MAG: DUF3313 family protein, partial [Halioglobus sp.]|nr:DUF3313 family protein [Halioglobus sp.]
MNKPLWALAVACVALAACQTEPHIQTGADAEVIDGNLHRVDNTSLDKSYIDPEVDFSQYNAVLLQPLSFDDLKIVQPNVNLRLPGNPQWQLTDRDKTQLADAYRKAMATKLTENGIFSLASAPGPGTVTLSARLVRLAPNAPKDDFESRPIGRTRIVTEGFGSATIAFTLADSVTGNVL